MFKVAGLFNFFCPYQILVNDLCGELVDKYSVQSDPVRGEMY